MSEINATNSVLSDFSIANQQSVEPKKNELGQSAFLDLMIAQLKAQNPLEPQDNSEFVAQLAQFSSVESLDKLNNNFNSFTSNFLANQALQASSLVGRSVTVPADTTQLDAGDVVSASIDVPASTGDVSVNIYSENGALVDQVSLGPQVQGELVLRWDGMFMEVNGEMLEWQSSNPEGAQPGTYRFEVLAAQDGDQVELNTSLSANVNSVTLGADGALILNLAGVGAVNLADVKQFN